MDRLTNAGRYIFAISIGGFGVQYFIYAHAPHELISIPPYTLTRPLSAYLFGAALIVVSLSLANGKKAALSARLLAAALIPGFLILFVPMTLDPRGFEILAIAATAFVLAAAFPEKDNLLLRGPFDVRTTAQVARVLFAVSLAIFGIFHLRYPTLIASLIPAWIPAHPFFTYFTSACLFAAAVSIASGKLTRLAGTLLGAMLLIFVAVLHIPRVAHAPHSADEWASLLVALCIGGAGFIFAGEIR